MIKRPLNPRFNDAVLEGRKITTIRDSFWRTDAPVMLYNWSGLPYRSKQINVAAVVVEFVQAIDITNALEGMVFSQAGVGDRPLHETEGFSSREDLEDWFRPLVKPGQTVTKFIMRFRLLTPQVEAPNL